MEIEQRRQQYVEEHVRAPLDLQTEPRGYHSGSTEVERRSQARTMGRQPAPIVPKTTQRPDRAVERYRISMAAPRKARLDGYVWAPRGLQKARYRTTRVVRGVDPKLAAWVRTQRSSFHRIEETQIDILNDIGFEYKTVYLIDRQHI